MEWEMEGRCLPTDTAFLGEEWQEAMQHDQMRSHCGTVGFKGLCLQLNLILVIFTHGTMVLVFLLCFAQQELLIGDANTELDKISECLQWMLKCSGLRCFLNDTVGLHFAPPRWHLLNNQTLQFWMEFTVPASCTAFQADTRFTLTTACCCPHSVFCHLLNVFFSVNTRGVKSLLSASCSRTSWRQNSLELEDDLYLQVWWWCPYLKHIPTEISWYWHIFICCVFQFTLTVLFFFFVIQGKGS